MTEFIQGVRIPDDRYIPVFTGIYCTALYEIVWSCPGGGDSSLRLGCAGPPAAAAAKAPALHDRSFY
jgi:hypothetical protein